MAKEQAGITNNHVCRSLDVSWPQAKGDGLIRDRRPR